MVEGKGAGHQTSQTVHKHMANIPQLNDVVADMFLTNIMSGRHVGLLARAGEQSGARGVEALAKSGCRGKCLGNLTRDFMSVVLRGCTAPPIYLAVVPVFGQSYRCGTRCAVPLSLGT